MFKFILSPTTIILSITHLSRFESTLTWQPLRVFNYLVSVRTLTLVSLSLSIKLSPFEPNSRVAVFGDPGDPALAALSNHLNHPTIGNN